MDFHGCIQLLMTNSNSDVASLKYELFGYSLLSTGGTIMFLNIPREIIALLDGARV